MTVLLEKLNSTDFVVGLFMLVLGITFIFFHNQLGKKAGEFQKRWFFDYPYAEKFNQYGYLLGGVLISGFGIYMILGKIKPGDKLW